MHTNFRGVEVLRDGDPLHGDGLAAHLQHPLAAVAVVLDMPRGQGRMSENVPTLLHANWHVCEGLVWGKPGVGPWSQCCEWGNSGFVKFAGWKSTPQNGKRKRTNSILPRKI